MQCKLVYICGPYRHYCDDGNFDDVKMLAELEDERKWSIIVAQAGHFPIRPLANSHDIADAISQEDWIQRDLELIQSLSPEKGLLLIRSGAFNTIHQSEGARRERECAENMGLPIHCTASLGNDPALVMSYLEAIGESPEAVSDFLHGLARPTVVNNKEKQCLKC
jgi:hypothetical protein